MQWFTKLFRKKADPLALLRVAPTDEQIAEELAQVALYEDMAILARGSVEMSPYTNCAYGTWGYRVMQMARDGRMIGRGHGRYEITAKGREFLAKHA